MPSSKNYKRDYVQEYKTSQSSTKAKKDRASRNAARRKMISSGKARKGDGKDIAHKNGNPRDNRSSNLSTQSKSKNRSYARTKTAGKKNPRS